MSDGAEALRGDLESLAQDFGRLFGTDCECVARITRTYWPSRYPEPRTIYEPIAPDGPWESVLGGDGIEVDPEGVRTVEDAKAAAVYYDRSGRPVVNSAGQPVIKTPGWKDWNEIYLRGPGSSRAAETIHRCNELIGRYAGTVLSAVLPPARCVRLSADGMPWLSGVNLVADVANRSVLKPAAWCVTANKQSYSVELWKRRAECELGKPMIAPELVEAIGDEPENVYCDRRAFLRDSELAVEYLISKLTNAPEKLTTTPENYLNEAGRVLRWDGQEYPLTKNMLGVIKVLWDADASGRPDVSLEVIRNNVDAWAIDEGLSKVFQRRKSGKKYTDPVWGVVDCVGPGVYRLRKKQR